jgi:hypothetical protein
MVFRKDELIVWMAMGRFSPEVTVHFLYSKTVGESKQSKIINNILLIAEEF